MNTRQNIKSMQKEEGKEKKKRKYNIKMDLFAQYVVIVWYIYYSKTIVFLLFFFAILPYDKIDKRSL